MKKIIFSLLALMLPVISIVNAQVTCYRVHFSDKNNSPYSVNAPQDFLSQRAIDKRERFQIPVTETDLPINPSYIGGVISLDGEIVLLSKSKWDNSITIYCPNNETLNGIRDLPYIDSLLPVATYQLTKSTIENPEVPFAPYNEVVREDSIHYGNSFGQIAIHNGHQLHAAGYLGEGMLIAVLDAGWENFNVLPRYQSLFDNGQIVGVHDMLPVNNVYVGHEHGTYVTSIMCSNINDSLVGTAPNADYFLIRTENPWSEEPIEEDFWAAGAEFADSIGADVINSSLGYTVFDNDSLFATDYTTCDGQTGIASRAATLAAERGIIVCVSAGNEGMSEWHHIGRPADAFNVLAIGAVDKDSLYAPFSSVGPSYDGRVKPDIASVGWNTVVMTPGDSIIEGNGTSFSSPVIAGLSACLWQALPQKNATEIMQIIRESAHQILQPDTLMGFGIPDFYQAFLQYYEPDTNAITTFCKPSNAFLVYPNPCQSTVTVKSTFNTIQNVAVYDLSGKCLPQLPIINHGNSAIINLHSVQCGMYLVEIVDNSGEKEIFKLLKINN